MAPQDGLYAMLVRDGSSERARIIGAVQRVIVAPEEPQALLDALASPDTHVVTLTITEKGYKLDPATGALIERSEEHTSELQSLMRISYAVFCLKKKKSNKSQNNTQEDET